MLEQALAGRLLVGICFAHGLAQQLRHLGALRTRQRRNARHVARRAGAVSLLQVEPLIQRVLVGAVQRAGGTPLRRARTRIDKGMKRRVRRVVRQEAQGVIPLHGRARAAQERQQERASALLVHARPQRKGAAHAPLAVQAEEEGIGPLGAGESGGRRAERRARDALVQKRCGHAKPPSGRRPTGMKRGSPRLTGFPARAIKRRKTGGMRDAG